MNVRPLARSGDLLLERVGDEIIVYDTNSKEAHCLSPRAAAVFEHCDGRTSVEQLAGVASQQLSERVDAAHVRDALSQLEQRGLLAARASLGGLSRRDMLRRSAVVGAATMAAPLITTIVAPTPAAAATPTCGDILCCPCHTGQGGQACCAHATAFNCNCVSAEGDCGKQCKASGAAPGEEDCLALFPGDGIPDGAPCPCTTAIC